jgi:hypothetical protein
LGLAAEDLLALRLSRNFFDQPWIGVTATRVTPRG